MSNYKVITDSAGDLTQEMADELDVEVIPMDFTIGSDTFKNYPDYRCISPHDFYTRIAAGEPSKTTQIGPSVFIETFEKYLKQGTDVLYISFSSGMSGTYSNSMIAAKKLSEKYPDRKVLTADSLSASLGEGLLVWDAVQKKKAGASIEEVQQWVQQNNVRMHHWFTVDDLNHLKRGGRLSASAALVGTLLGIKPVLQVNGYGKLEVTDKVRGRKQALDMLVKHMEETQENAAAQYVFISHTDYLEGAEYVKEKVESEFRPKEVKIGYMGPIIGAHTGTGLIALFYLGSVKKH
ncbi:MAG TPA: fatty acid-binding protein DegV [Ruminococcaceae bacterium]|jgi:DegV family protein with EDD domain|nr:fatty acid-binding protein DegV [Oscillospiraceae bacterium]